MAARMYMGVRLMVLLVVAMGTTSVFATRDLLEFNRIPGLDSLANAVNGQTVTLVDIPGLKITSRTEAPSDVTDLAALLRGDAEPLTMSVTDRIEGNWLNPVTFSSTTQLNPNIITTLLSRLTRGAPRSVPSTAHFSLPDFPLPRFNISQFPGWLFPFGSPPPSSPPPPPHRQETSPPPSPHHKTSPAPRREPSPNETSSPSSSPRHESPSSTPPPKRSHADSPRSSSDGRN